MRYKINKYEKEINILNSDFVNINKNNSLYIIFNEEIFGLKDKFDFSKYIFNNDFLEIKLCGIHNIQDASNMFYDCKSLISLPDIWKWNTSNITNMSHMFYNCHSLISLPNISNWNIINVTNIDYMFYKCSSLKTLPDISHWKTNNIIDI